MLKRQDMKETVMRECSSVINHIIWRSHPDAGKR
nr:MAG TPA: hypothetical protein [Bacteriophage sp.]